MKRYFYILAFLFVFQQTYAIYSTPGTGRNWNLDSLVANSSGHFTFSGGNYFLNDTLIISQSDTIKVFQNAIIKMGNLSLLYVYGTLLINPVDSAKITAADTTLKHIGIRMDSTSSASVLKKLIFEYGNSIYMLNCNILIDSCIIRFNTNYISGMQSGAIALFKANPTISHCKIFRNRRAAIVSGNIIGSLNSSPIILGNLIYENDMENGLYPQINLGAGNVSTILIKNNTIRGFNTNSGGIAYFPTSSTITNIVIENNIIKRNSYGIVLYNANINAYINNNIIDSNNINSNAMVSGSGININGTSTLNVICTRNMIRWNLWGVTVQSTAKPNFGDISNSDTTDIGLNKIYNNGHNDTIFDFYYNVTTTDTLKAENNYWGIINADSIEAHVWHKVDFPSLGFVDYNPFRLVTNVENNYSNTPSEYKLFDAYPNPFNPSTNIKYQIANNSFISLKVYDVLGKEITTLVDEQQKPGAYTIKFSINLLTNNKIPSGIYFYRLTTDGFSETKKLILLK
ncbi:MAG: T9SS type A sorting domain-containing protein [Ignavibacteriae bacterium]|nr:T9SS type A sorting domain-containing protein [Ignavibacteriota bacterium]